MTMIARRRFIASTGITATPLIGMGWSTSQAREADKPPNGSTWNLLAVAPQSRKIVGMKSDYRRGLELGLSQHASSDVRLHWVDAPAIPRMAEREIARQMDLLPELHGVVGWMSPAVAEKVVAQTRARDLPLWVSDTGADLALEHNGHRAQPDRRHSLELCQCASVLAREVWTRLGPRAVLAEGWMESGYDFVHVFEQAYRALGGQVVARHVGNPATPTLEFDGLKRVLFEHRPDAVVALYSGPQASRFVQWWSAQALSLGPWSLAGLPWLEEAGADSLAVSSWPYPDAMAPTVWNERFSKALLPWSAAAVLGAEAGNSIGASLAGNALLMRPSKASLRTLWSQASLTGPRGSRSWAASGADSHGTMWTGAEGEAMAAHGATDAFNFSSQSSSSGWLTGYLQT
ncbi:hypothetical protein G7047_09570 [Diaphorobacter sp. HDW4A]|uniref:hypothetical protein n=1 Tax=Diaphorobacter sp. HDW4A TaxID=2714924 RepID=UPI0014074795|nr:hypothetical protein [Diaphorobacter sp. HDW4A]QIL80125.1 hypothetical protein G7047_09570 [Diaphorobacter sp. HDW4A]